MLYNLQIFRGTAAASVVLAHVNLLLNRDLFAGLFIEGRSGVDFFFILSGFIIFYVHHRDLGQPARTSYYLQKRAVRIFPAYWAYTALALCGAAAFRSWKGYNFIDWINLDAVNIAKTVLLYPTNKAVNEMPVLPVAWTLSYEILFYAVFSLLIILERRIARWVFPVWALLIFASTLGIAGRSGNLLVRLVLDSKNYEFMLGCVVALVFLRHGGGRLRGLSPAILAAGVLWLAYSWTMSALVQTVTGNIAKLTRFGIPYALIVLGGVSLDARDEEPSGRVRRFFIYLGNASYSMYLVHFPLITVLVAVLGGRRSYPEFLLISALSLAAGCLAYEAVERPLLAALKRRLRRPAAPRPDASAD